MSIYTVIVTYNAMRWIDKCLRCVAAASQPSTIIVVDNCSTDGTAEHIPAAYPQVVWLPQKQNLGFGQGNNIAIEYAIGQGAEFILLLNQDAYVDKEMLRLLVDASDGKNLFVPMMLNGDGSAIDEMFACAIGIGLRYSSAACWLLPASMIRQIGGFNPLFFHYSEDNNYADRLAFHGYKIIIVPRAIVCHDRKRHGNIEVYNKSKLYRDMLLPACDINRNTFSVIIQYLRVLKHRIRDPRAFFSALYAIIGQRSAISASRRAERLIGNTWLNLPTQC